MWLIQCADKNPLRWETVDTAETEDEARMLVSKYRDWHRQPHRMIWTP